LAGETGEPQTHTPWHLLALRAEIDYASSKLAERGIVADASEVARGLYGIHGNADWVLKMSTEMHAIGERWSDVPANRELVDALSI